MQNPAAYSLIQRGWLSSNSILFQSTNGVTIVDTGYCSHAEQILKLVESYLPAGHQLQAIVNTHLHSDHCGGNALLQSAFPLAKTWIPAGQAQAVETWDEQRLSYKITGQNCPRFTYSDLLQPGAKIRLGADDWQIHSAPGHDPHSMLLFEPKSRILISADALWENGFGVVFQELEGDQAFDEVAATLDLIEQLDPKIIIPGHGAEFTDLKSALGRARARLDKFLADPLRHAQYAAKVLMKFKLLELQSCSRSELRQWHVQTPYSHMIHQRFFSTLSFNDWFEEILADLIRSGAASKQGEIISNSN